MHNKFMKPIKFLLLLFLLSLSVSLDAQGTAVSNEFYCNFATLQNHNLTYLSGQNVVFKPNYPCIIVGGYSVNATGKKKVWGIHDGATYLRWDSLATQEAKGGAMRFVDMMNEDCEVHMPEDMLFMPNSYTLDWLKLAGYPLPVGFLAAGVTVLVFDPTKIK